MFLLIEKENDNNIVGARFAQELHAIAVDIAMAVRFQLEQASPVCEKQRRTLFYHTTLKRTRNNQTRSLR